MSTHNFINDEVKINRVQSSDTFSSYIQINTFSFESKKQKLPAFYRINGILFQSSDFAEEFILPVMRGSYRIEVGYIGKEELILKKLEVEKGDSVIVQFYLKDDLEPLY